MFGHYRAADNRARVGVHGRASVLYVCVSYRHPAIAGLDDGDVTNRRGAIFKGAQGLPLPQLNRARFVDEFNFYRGIRVGESG